MDEPSNPETERLAQLAYSELRKIATGYLRRERGGHTLQPTALVNEAYIRLLGQKRITWLNRSHFVGTAAHLMRRVLREYARERNAAKRRGNQPHLIIGDSVDLCGQPAVDFLALENALNGLAKLDRALAEIVQLRFFGGLSIEETAEFLNVSPATVKRNWVVAKAYLYRELSEIPQP